jgi:hypothetical protein
VLLRQGVAGWMQMSAEISITNTPATTPRTDTGTRWPHAATAEVVHVLAAMALRYIEVRV